MDKLTPNELRKRIKQNNAPVLIDVREEQERAAYNIGGMHIPMGELIARMSEIPKDKEVILYCEKGIRSVIAIQRLQASGYYNLINLAGGMKAWKEGEDRSS
jgi:rhodanese-related sulfurtransferase